MLFNTSQCHQMEYKFYKTSEIPDNIFKSYIIAFNKIFDKGFIKDYFINKYKNVSQGYSYHCFMIDVETVVGACTFIPYEYNYFGEKLIFSLAVGLFVLPEYRQKNPMAMYVMYNTIKDGMKEDNVAFAFAVPNKISYPFWTKILKWQDIGSLSYYALPVKFGKVVKKTSFFDGVTTILIKTWISGGKIISNFISNSQKNKPIFINRKQNKFEQNRYFDEYTLSKDKGFWSYKIYDEGGIKTAYLIDFYNEEGKRDSKVLARAITAIINTNEIDLIVFIGELDFFQFSLFKVPKLREPKRLPLIGEILNEKIDEKIFNFNSWEVGLLNYDVR